MLPFSAATDRLGRSEQFPRQQATPLHLGWRAITSGVGTRNEPAGEDEKHRIGGGFGEKGADVGWFNETRICLRVERLVMWEWKERARYGQGI